MSGKAGFSEEIYRHKKSFLLNCLYQVVTGIEHCVRQLADMSLTSYKTKKASC
jgi:hypothetical protein